MQERVHSTMRFVQRCFTTPFFICLASLFAVASTTKVEQYSSVNKHNGKGWAVESTSSVQAVRDLIERVAPGASNYFEIELFNGNYGDSKLPMMGLGSTTDGKVLLRGSTGVELASALNWYLQDYCNSTYDWSTYQ